MFGSSDDNEAAPAVEAAKPVVQLKKVEKSKMQQKAEAHAAKQAAAKKAAASQPKPEKEEEVNVGNKWIAQSNPRLYFWTVFCPFSPLKN